MISCSKMGMGESASHYLTKNNEDYYAYDEVRHETEFWDPHAIVCHGALHRKTVDPKEFGLLCAGRDPKTSDQLTSSVDNKHRAGIDFTFSAPKSFSLIYAFRPDLREKLMSAHKASVKRALAFMSEKAGVTRSKDNGIMKYEPCNLVVAMFPHHESRRGDMQEHVHCAILNVTKNAAGDFRTIDTRKLLQWRPAVAARYHAEFSARLNDLGIKTKKEGRNFECAEVPQFMCQHFSKSRNTLKQVAEELKSHLEYQNVGVKTELGELAQKVIKNIEKEHVGNHFVLKSHHCDIEKKENKGIVDIINKTIREKKVSMPYQELEKHWQKQIKENDFKMSWLESVVRESHKESFDVENFSYNFLSELSNASPLFKEEELYACLGECGIGRFSANDLDEIVKHMRNTNQLIEVEVENNGIKWLTTLKQIELEVGLINSIEEQKKYVFHSVSHQLAQKAISEVEQQENIKLSEEQRACVFSVLSEKGAICAYEGLPGVGKSVSLRAINQAYTKGKNFKVLGAALSKNAANVLESSSGIKSSTIDKLLIQIESGQIKLDKMSVVVIDEAGLLGTRKVYSLMSHVIAGGAKLILTGDSKQLLPIEGGQVLPVLDAQVGSKKISSIRRQSLDDSDANPFWRRELVSNLSKGLADKAVAHLKSRNLLIISNAEASALSQMVDEWLLEKKRDPSHLMMAVSNKDVDLVNFMVRHKLKQVGKIQPSSEVSVDAIGGKKQFCIGDKVLMKMNQGNITNGSIGEIIDISFNRGQAHFRIKENDKIHQVSKENYANQQGVLALSHGYCQTIYSSQGKTAKSASLYLGPSVNKRLSFVGLSRAKENTKVYVSKERWAEQVKCGKIEEVTPDMIVEQLIKKMSSDVSSQMVVEKIGLRKAKDILKFHGLSADNKISQEHYYHQSEKAKRGSYCHLDQLEKRYQRKKNLIETNRHSSMAKILDEFSKFQRNNAKVIRESLEKFNVGLRKSSFER